MEQEFADRVIPRIALDDGWRKAVPTCLAHKNPQPDHSGEVQRLEMALANLRKQHLWSAMTDEDFRSEFRQIECQLRALSTPQPDVPTPNLDRTTAILRDLSVLWRHQGVTPRQHRNLAGEVFEEIRLRGQTLVAFKPRPHHAPLFAYSIWRQQQVFGGTSLF
ncbi:MAG: hypothetical protein Q7T26_08320 [Dehalococcoidia bacterium]|nr:hypothetical protein [Dehalococcoidia bacterium]